MRLKPLAALTSAGVLLLAMSAVPSLADQATPSVSQTQSNQIVRTSGAQTSAINGNAGAGAQGNIGLNAAAGDSNAQSNAIILEGTPGSNQLSTGSAAPTVSQSLTALGNNVLGGQSGQASGSDSSTLGDTAASGNVPAGTPQGNFAANSSAGDFNEQANVLLLSGKGANGSVQATTTQAITGAPQGGSNVTTDMRGLNYSATLTGTMGKGSLGNAGLDSAAGEKNLQANSLQLFSTNAANAASAAQSLNQSIGPNGTAGSSDFVTNAGGLYTASVSGSALSGAQGNAGANVASGASNIQSNATMLTGTTPLTSISQTGTQSLTNVFAAPSSFGPTSASNVSSGGQGSTAAGNLGINSAAGDQNLQSNALVLGDPPGPIVQTFNQTATGNTAVSSGTSFSGISGSAGLGYTGNLAISSVAGMQNQQLNLATIATGDITTATQTFNQNIAGVGGVASGTKDSHVGGSTASNATGNIGVASAAGAQNMQANGTIIASGGANSVSQFFNQQIGKNGTTPSAIFMSPGNVTSEITDSAASFGSGKIGIDSAAGLQNVQANGLVIVSGTSPVSGPNSGSMLQMPAAAVSGPTINAAIYTVNGGFMSSRIDSNAGANASNGVLGFNSAAGVQNVQNNGATIYSGSAAAPNSTENYTQSTTLAADSNGVAGSSMAVASTTATVSGNAGSEASPSQAGVIGFNSAAGAQNVQSNGVSLFAPRASGTPGSSQQSTQTVTGGGNSVQFSTFGSTATLGGNAGRNAGGVAGINVASGGGNQQAGLTTLIDGTSGAGPVGDYSPTFNVNQSVSSVNERWISAGGGSTIGDANSHAFDHATGVISANSAAGGYNQQSNVTLLTAGNLGDIQPTINLQSNSGSTFTGIANPNTSTIGAGAFANASGVIGASSAAGSANQQVNNVVVQH